MPNPLTRRQALVSLGAVCAGAVLPSIRAFAQISPSSAAATVSPASPGSGQPLLFSLADYEALARERMSRVAWEYINSGSADEFTLQWNRDALNRIRLEPRVMIDVSHVDPGITLLGQKLPHPILVAPTASHMLVDPAEGEVATVRGAGEAGAIMVASTVSNRSIEEINAAATRPVWFQLYVESDRGLTREIIQRAETAGSQALCITVDLPVAYGRNRIAHVDRESPLLPFPNLNLAAAPATRPRSTRGRNTTFNWKDLEWLQSFAKTPIILKGILSPNDAEQAVRHGAKGIIVSNHGGRGLDSVPATIDALPRVVDRVAGRIPVLVDGGIRRGTDILKGLAFGATAVLIGRPSLYGLAVNGGAGVRHVIEILRTELEAAMALTGKTSIVAIDRTVLWKE